jgi:hypothetical protein
MYEAFAALEPVMSANGMLVMGFAETDEHGEFTGAKHMFPMVPENAKQYVELLQKALGQRIETADLQKMREEVARAVPGNHRG